MKCLHCGMPLTNTKRGIDIYACGSTFDLEYDRSDACHEIERLKEREGVLESNITYLEGLIDDLTDHQIPITDGPDINEK